MVGDVVGAEEAFQGTPPSLHHRTTPVIAVAVAAAVAAVAAVVAVAEVCKRGVWFETYIIIILMAD